ncbi:MAG TPA: PLP-dependent transferase [Thermoleophilaceae bacterium]
MKKKPGTRVVHAGLPEAEAGRPFLPGPVFAAPFHLPGDDPHAAPFGYARDGHPTLALYEQAVAELDDATAATVFGSGMAACSAVLLTCLKPGDLLVASADGYNTVRALANGYLADRGIELRYCQTDGDWNVDGARLVWVESPSNPELRVTDIAVLARRAHDAGALVAVDNTLLTPLGQRPLELGADFAVYSDTKAMTGHSDVLMGHVATRDDELGRQIRDWRTTTGSLPGPFEAWLAHRSLATLDVRLERQQRNAQAIAALLNARGIEARCRGMVVSFTLDNAQRFLEACELVIGATSFGGVHSTAERRARWNQGDDVAEGFIRFSAGIEDTDDLLEDVHRALEASATN